MENSIEASDYVFDDILFPETTSTFSFDFFFSATEAQTSVIWDSEEKQETKNEKEEKDENKNKEEKSDNKKEESEQEQVKLNVDGITPAFETVIHFSVAMDVIYSLGTDQPPNTVRAPLVPMGLPMPIPVSGTAPHSFAGISDVFLPYSAPRLQNLSFKTPLYLNKQIEVKGLKFFELGMHITRSNGSSSGLFFLTFFFFFFFELKKKKKKTNKKKTLSIIRQITYKDSLFNTSDDVLMEVTCELSHSRFQPLSRTISMKTRKELIRLCSVNDLQGYVDNNRLNFRVSIRVPRQIVVDTDDASTRFVDSSKIGTKANDWENWLDGMKEMIENKTCGDTDIICELDNVVEKEVNTNVDKIRQLRTMNR
ncbi:hypothetical protein RFI_27139 [Reticulomyxa filosa]|uniref:Uncharacterized protein n=1 Tax=Reticulomyxa filosa TaxID=46433 RepID=X6M8J7_RETFI|nr:hypothetical protein RFI_27139 [Reticulomyxa filosa]|eukprot:ETO10239.1 hypothetical protein RFI_27139 [Reticulomyxa filosa]